MISRKANAHNNFLFTAYIVTSRQILQVIYISIIKSHLYKNQRRKLLKSTQNIKKGKEKNSNNFVTHRKVSRHTAQWTHTHTNLRRPFNNNLMRPIKDFIWFISTKNKWKNIRQQHTVAFILLLTLILSVILLQLTNWGNYLRTLNTFEYP